MLWNWTTAFEDAEVLRREMETLLDRTQRYFTGNQPNFPLVNIYSQEDKVLVLAELPGVAKEDVELSFMDGALKIKGQRKTPELGDKLVQLREERLTGQFEKTIRLPIDVDLDQMQARFQDGILQIELPKPEKIKPRQIAIQ